MVGLVWGLRLVGNIGLVWRHWSFRLVRGQRLVRNLGDFWLVGDVWN